MIRKLILTVAALLIVYGRDAEASPNNKADKAAGLNHACFIDAGALKCLGANDFGQLGQGTHDAAAHPAATIVSGMSSGVTAVSSGDDSVCAIKGGQVYCWGYNSDGEAATGSFTSSVDTPTLVSATGFTNSNVAELVAGAYHFCVVKDHATTSPFQGHMWCWGMNGQGQLGVGDTTNRNVPVEVFAPQFGVGNLPLWTGLMAGGTAFMCGQAIAQADNTSHPLVCWGENGYGQLGDGTITAHNKPANSVQNATDGVTLGGSGTIRGTLVALTATVETMCASVSSTLHQAGIYCWGGNNYATITMNGVADSLAHRQPSYLGILSMNLSVGPGAEHLCYFNSGTLTVLCWGANEAGQLGNKTFTTLGAIGTMYGNIGLGPFVLSPDGSTIASGFNNTMVSTSINGVKYLFGSGGNFVGQLGQSGFGYYDVAVDAATY